MEDKNGIVLTSQNPFENGLAFWDKGYVLLGGLGFVFGFLKNGFAAGSFLMLLGLFLGWIVKANVALAKWRGLRYCQFALERQIPMEELTAKLVAALAPYGLRVDIVDQKPFIAYRNIKIQVCYNENGTFSMPWSQGVGWFFLDFRYISSYHNTVAVMSIVGYHVQQLGREQTEPVERKPAPDTDAGKVIYDQNGLIAPLPGKRRRKPPVGAVMAVIAVGITAVSLLIPRDSQYINAVKNGYPNAYPDKTYGEAFENFFENQEWTYFKSSDGLDIVEFSGDYQNSFSEIPVTFQFTLSEDGDTMEATYCELNGEPQNQMVLAILIAAVFEEDSFADLQAMEAAGEETAWQQEKETEAAVQTETQVEEAEETFSEVFAESDEDFVSEYIFPDSNVRLLSNAELEALSADELRLAVNEIYARHGRKFSDAGLQEYFNSKSWYQGTIEPDQFNEMVLNDFEKENARMLSERRSAVSAADSGSQTIYGLYECHEDGLDASLEVGVYTDNGTEYISLTGASSDGSGYGEFYGTVVSSNDNHFTAVDDSGNAIDIYFDGTGKASITDDTTSGGLYFPGFTGTYQKTEDFSNAG